MASLGLVSQHKKTLAFFCLCISFIIVYVVEIITPGIVLPQRRRETAFRGPCRTVVHSTCSRQSCVECPKIPNPRGFSEDKNDISRKLEEIHLVLKTAIEHKTTPTPGTLLTLEGIIEQMNPASNLSKVREKAKPEAVNMVNTSQAVSLDVCPEEYRGEEYGYPFFHTGWVLTNCSNAKPLSQVLTILLNTVEYPEEDEQQVGVVLQGINSTYPGVAVYLAPKNDKITALASNYGNVTVLNATVKGGSAWNRLVSLVTTPYVLIARDLVHFDVNARLERQIYMISDTDYVGVVGGAFRNLTGHWRIGCRQSRMMNYVLKYQEGYYYSRKSCMFCDDLEGPFVARTDILMSTKLSEKLPKEVIFEDFFIRVLRSGYLVMNCPDVMYYSADYSSRTKQENKPVWQEFAKEWVLVRVLLPGYVKHAFSCKEISFKCDSFAVTKNAPFPMCCLEQFGTAMKYMQDFCMKHHIPFELDAGSNLAAVKYSNYNPYDLDGDMSMLSWNYSFIKENAGNFEKSGYPISGYSAPKFANGKVSSPGYFKFWSPEIYTEVNGFSSVSAEKHLPPDLRDIKHFTKAQINGHWINAMFSPGLYARNRYGLDVLKHAQSWLQVGGMGSSWGRYKAGKFLKCNKPDFHSCLNKFPADGNMAFKVDD